MAQVGETLLLKNRRRRRFLRALLAAVVLAVVTFRNPLFRGNYGVVDPQRVYRSAQPVAELRRRIADDHLASILNLRGGATTDPFYAAEVRATQEGGVDFYDLPLSAIRRPQRRELLLLLDLFDRCRYPLLIHCKSGSDRTGLAAALYLMSRRDEPPEKALRAFSLFYGHVPLLGPEHLHEPFLEYAAWLKAQHQAHTPARFRWWVREVYRAEDREGDVPPLQPGPRKALAAKKAGTDATPLAGEPDLRRLRQGSD